MALTSESDVSTRVVLATRRRLAVSATVAVAGIALSAVVDQALGGWVTIAGIASLLLGLHRFGRTGPA